MSFAWIFKLAFIVAISTAASTPIKIQNPPSSGWVFSADFLAWFASQEPASIWADVTTIGVDTSSWGAPSFDFRWDYGFRIGAGYDLAYDQWDTVVYWNWFQTDATHAISFAPNTTLHPEFFAGFLNGGIPRSMKANWKLLLNMFDWELGRICWIDKRFSLRPFLGIKGGWIHQSIHAYYSNLTFDLIFQTNDSGTEHLKNNFWGVGPLGGINTKWRVSDFGSHFFDLLGDFSLATLFGAWDCSDNYENSLPQTYSVNTDNSPLGGLMFRGFLGVGWDLNFRKGRSHFATKVGYETQIWINQLRIATFQLQRLHNDLSLQGITCSCRFDF